MMVKQPYHKRLVRVLRSAGKTSFNANELLKKYNGIEEFYLFLLYAKYYLNCSLEGSVTEDYYLRVFNKLSNQYNLKKSVDKELINYQFDLLHRDLIETVDFFEYKDVKERTLTNELLWERFDKLTKSVAELQIRKSELFQKYSGDEEFLFQILSENSSVEEICLNYNEGRQSISKEKITNDLKPISDDENNDSIVHEKLINSYSKGEKIGDKKKRNGNRFRQKDKKLIINIKTRLNRKIIFIGGILLGACLLMFPVVFSFKDELSFVDKVTINDNQQSFTDQKVLPENLKIFDVDMNKKISLGEVYGGIDMFFESGEDIDVEHVYSLIDYYFEN